MKIGIIGNYGATNIGDDAILTAILKSLEGHNVTVFSAHPDMTKPLFGEKSAPLFPLGIRSIFRDGFRDSKKALKKVDAVILGGGGLFQDSYILACFLWAWQIFWVKRMRKPLFIYSAGVGPLNTMIGKRLSKWAYDQAEIVTVRDEYSKKTLRDIGFKGEITVTADPVFNCAKPNFAKGRTKNLFIISLRPWLKYNDHILSVFGKFLSKLKEEKDARFIFVSMQQIKQHDLQMIEPLVSKLGGEIYLPTHYSQVLQVMETAEFAIGMRYHFMIAALITQTPILPISYTPKTETLFAGSRLEQYVIKVEDLSEKRLTSDLRKLSASYNNAIVYEKAMTSGLRVLAQEDIRLLESFLKKIDRPPKDW